MYTIKQLNEMLDGKAKAPDGSAMHFWGSRREMIIQFRDALAKIEIDKITMDNFLGRLNKLETTIGGITKHELGILLDCLIVADWANCHPELRKKLRRLEALQEQDNE